MSKKGASTWKLLILILVGFCGIYLCWMGVDYKLSGRYMRQKLKDIRLISLCSGTVGSNPFRHYPKPVKYERGQCACSPVHNFVILSMQRSGSGWFETLLNSHPNISSQGEVFSIKSRRVNFTAIVNTLDTIYNLDWISSASKNECTTAVGFKWMLNQGVMEYNKEALTYFHENGVSIIFLLRRNLLKRLVSVLANAYDRDVKLLNGTHKAHVHSAEEAEALAAYQPFINKDFLPAHFQRVLDITNNAIQYFNSTRHTTVYYEDLVKNYQILDEVLTFLGVPRLKLGSQHVKIHTKPLKDQIKNWKEVLHSLEGTKFEDFLKDNDYL